MDTLDKIKKAIKHAMNSEFYRKYYAGINVEDIKSMEDFQKLPFTDKEDLREAYPLGLLAVPDEKIVRVHSSSGTTGAPVIIPYTQKDVHDWAIMFKRRDTDFGQRESAFRPERNCLARSQFRWGRETRTNRLK